MNEQTQVTMRIRVALVDDHPVFREGVLHALESQPDMEVVGQGRSAREAIHLAQTLHPDLVLLDLDMPGGGIDAARAIAASCPGVRIVMLTVSEEEEDVGAAFEAGATAYVLKGVSGRDLVKILRIAHAGRRYVDPALARGARDPGRAET